MSLNLKRLSVRLEILSRTKAEFQVQFLQLMQLRELVKQAQLSVDLQNAARTRNLAPVVVAAAA